ncbi:hypothetical protein SAJA_12200 [Salinisphaera japonica YTM-1]|uniref:Uncharacterized protein n=2 Tax=Salinisphaera TaxID=180541 RepID=A0A423PJS8_9GAMM|nr:hypothetical protein SAJA_12200 [Salinisphaera japonica YTM-1]
MNDSSSIVKFKLNTTEHTGQPVENTVMKKPASIASSTLRRSFIGLAGLIGLAFLASTSPAHAGIDVRAPFTHVGVDRDHGVNIAAPFTRLNVDGHRHHRDRRSHHRGFSHQRRAYSAHRGWRHDRRAYQKRAYRDHHRDVRRYHYERRNNRGFFGRW